MTDQTTAPQALSDEQALAELNDEIERHAQGVGARRQSAQTESLPAVRATPARNGRPAVLGVPADPHFGRRQRRILVIQERRLAGLITVRALLVDRAAKDAEIARLRSLLDALAALGSVMIEEPSTSEDAWQIKRRNYARPGFPVDVRLARSHAHSPRHPSPASHSNTRAGDAGPKRPEQNDSRAVDSESQAAAHSSQAPLTGHERLAPRQMSADEAMMAHAVATSPSLGRGRQRSEMRMLHARSLTFDRYITEAEAARLRACVLALRGAVAPSVLALAGGTSP